MNNVPAYGETGAPAITEVPAYAETGAPAITEVPAYAETGAPAITEVPAYAETGPQQLLKFQRMQKPTPQQLTKFQNILLQQQVLTRIILIKHQQQKAEDKKNSKYWFGKDNAAVASLGFLGLFLGALPFVKRKTNSFRSLKERE